MKRLVIFIVAALCFAGCDANMVDPRLPIKSFLNTTWESQSTSRVVVRADSIVVYERSTIDAQYNSRWRRNAWGIKRVVESPDSLILNMGPGWTIIAYRDSPSIWIAIWKNAPENFRQYF